MIRYSCNRYSIFAVFNYPISPNRRREEAFTMLEIMVAIFIFGIVVTTIFSSYRTVLISTESVQQTITEYEAAKNCLNRMILDLQSVYISLPPAYRPPDMNDPPDPYRVVGDTTQIGGTELSRLRFTSLAHVALGENKRDGIAEIVYYIQAIENDYFILRRSDKLYPCQPFEENGKDPVLCENVKLLAFTYYDQENNKYELWDSESDEFKYATPKAIGIKMEIGDIASPLLLQTMVTLPVFRKKIG